MEGADDQLSLLEQRMRCGSGLKWQLLSFSSSGGVKRQYHQSTGNL